MKLDINLALHYLAGRKTRTTLTTLAIVFGVMVIFGLSGIIPAMEESFIKGIQASTDGVDMRITSVSRNSFSYSIIEKAAAVEGVKKSTGIFEKGILLPESFLLKTIDGKAINSISILGIEPDKYSSIHKIEIINGKNLVQGSSGKILICSSLADKTGIAAGDILKLPSSKGIAEFTVEGVYKTMSAIKETIIMDLGDVQELFNQRGRINFIELVLSENEDADIVKSNVMKALGAGFSKESDGTGSELYTAVNMGQTIFAVLGYICIIMGGFIILVTFRAVAVERRHDIGMLRAVGCTKKRIFRIMLIEGALQGVAGTVIGIISGYALAWLFIFSVKGVWEEMIKVPFGNPVFSIGTWITSFIMGIGITIAGGIIPALSASRITPLDALRTVKGAYKPQNAGKRGAVGLVIMALSVIGLFYRNIGAEAFGLLAFITGLIITGPFIVKPLSDIIGKLLTIVFHKEGEMAKGNIKNQSERAAATTITVTIAIALVIALTGFTVSAVDGMKLYIEKSLGSDYILMPQSMLLGSGNMGAGPELVDSIKKIQGVAGATGISRATSKIGNNDLQVIGIAPREYSEISGLVFSNGDPEKAYELVESGRYLIANGITASTLGLKTGDSVKLETSEGSKDYIVAGVGLDFLNAKLSTIYISKSNVEKDFNEKDDVLVMVNTNKGTDMASVEKALNQKTRDYPAFSLFSAAEIKKTMMDSVNSVMSFIFILLIVMVVPSLIALVNTLSISVLERTREIGVMRAVGALRRQVKRIITIESLILAGIGTVLGIITGTWIGHLIVIATNSSGFKFNYIFPVEGIAAAIVIGLLLGIAGARLPARRAAKLDVVKALSYE